MKKTKMLYILAAASLVLAGCNKKPDSPVAGNMDNLANEVVETSTDSSSETSAETAGETVDEAVGGNAEYVRTIKDDKNKVNVEVRAQVEIPEADKLSVVRVSQKEFDDDFLNRFLDICEPDTVFTTDMIYTKEYCETKLAAIDDELKAAQEEADEEERSKGEASIEIRDKLYSLNEDLKTWQRNYDRAADDINREAVSKYAVTPKLVNVADELGNDPENSFYEWEYSLGTKEVFTGTNCGVDGRYVTVYMQNSEDNGNMFKYRVAGTWDIYVKTVLGNTCGIQRKKKADLKDFRPGAENYPELPNEADATLSADEAKAEAQELLDKLELTDYACKSAELCYEIPDFRDCNNKGDGYRMVYVMKYVRAFDGVFVDNEGGYMFLDNNDEKKIWEGERINVYVNDDGIVGFDYIAPLELGETVKDDCSLKSFDEIKTVFEDGITTLYNSGMEKLLDMDGKEVEYTDMGDKEDVKYTDIKVNKIILRYTRLSERSDFHTGLMVPVWDFIGDIEYGDTSGLSGQEKDKVVFTINAVDGSIVDRAAGY